MGLNSRGIYDPRFTPTIARVDEDSMTCRITVMRRGFGSSDGDDWDYENGKPAAGGVLFGPIAHTRARVTAQSAWSAQGYILGDQTTVFQAAKFNIPFTIPAEDWLVGGPVEFRDEDRIVIDEVFFPHLEPIKPFIYTVRSLLVNDTDAQWTLVTDANLKNRARAR